MPHRFRAPAVIYSGPGALAELAGLLADWGVRRAFVVTDPGLVRAGLVERLEALLDRAGVNRQRFDAVEPDPSVATAQAACDQMRDFAPDVVIGFGGGSSLDVAKVACAAAAGSGPVLAYAGQPLMPRRARLVQVPTTSGTGSEVTDRGILTLPESHVKQGFLSPHLIADAVCVDPELTLSLPPAVTAATGMDALTHAIEAYVSTGATPLTDTLALAAIERIGRSLRRAVHRGADLAARTDMALASLWAGLAFSNGGLGIVHALGMSLGSLYPVPHGVAVSLFLPYCLEFNVPADPARFARVAAALGEPVAGLSEREAAARLVPLIFQLAADVGIPARLPEVGVRQESLVALAEGAFAIKRLIDTNPRRVTLADCTQIAERAFGLR